MREKYAPRSIFLRTIVCVAAIAAGLLLSELTSAGASDAVSTPAQVEIRIGDLVVSHTETTHENRSLEGIWSPHDASLNSMRAGRVIEGATPHRLVLFTFDDGPNAHTTPRLLHLLDQLDIKAVFFLNANRIDGDSTRERTQADIARDIVARGHWIGNHSFSHQQLPLANNAEVAFQIDGARRIFERELGTRAWLFRPPGGARSARVDGLIESRGYTQMLWNLGTGDVQVSTPEEVVETWRRVMSRRERENDERGGIILLHDIHAHSVTAFVQIVADIRRRNCSLLERGEELFDIVDDPTLFMAPRNDEEYGVSAPALQLAPEVLARRQAKLRIETAVRCVER